MKSEVSANFVLGVQKLIQGAGAGSPRVRVARGDCARSDGAGVGCKRRLCTP